MAKALTVRLSEADAAELQRIAKMERRSVSGMGARMLDEWLRQYRYPEIEFRSIRGDRTACIKGRLEVWQVMMVARNYDNDAAKTAAHLELRPEQVRDAFDYSAAYPEEIASALAENDEGLDGLRRRLKNVEHVTLTNVK